MSDRDGEGSVADLWQEYKATHDPQLRNRLVLQYSPLVKIGRASCRERV